MSPAAEPVIRRLDAARQKWWFFTLATTTVLALCISLGMLLAMMLADAWLKFSQTGLAVLLLLWLALSATLVVLISRRLLRSQRSLEATARRIEAECPELGSNLINLVQLSEDSRSVDRAFCEAAVHQAADQIGYVSFDPAAGKQSRWRRFLHCMQTPGDLIEALGVLGLLVALAVLCQLVFANFSSAASRLMRPWQFVPSVGKVQIEVQPGDAEVMLGNSLEITATITSPEAKPYEAFLLVTPEGQPEQRLPMAAADNSARRYRHVLPSILQPLQYRLEIGDSQTPVYHVGVRQKPTVEDVRVVYRYPGYLGRNSDEFGQKQADLEAPQYTVADLRIRPSVPVAKGHVQLGPSQFLGNVEADGNLLVKGIPLLEDGSFTIHLVDDAGSSDPNPRQNRIHVLPDRPPTAQLLKPPSQSASAPGGVVEVLLRGEDDHGLGRVWLEMGVQEADVATDAPATESSPSAGQPDGVPAAGPSSPSQPAPPLVLQEWSGLESSTAVVRPYRLELSPEKFKPGQTVMLRAVAQDRRRVSDWGLDLKPQESASPWHAIRLAAPEEQAAAALEQLDGLRNAIFAIFEKQVRTRQGAAGIPQAPQLAGRTALAGEVRTGQVAVQKDSIALVKSLGQTQREEQAMAKRVLGTLAFGEMLQAVQQCDGLLRFASAEQFDQPAAELLATQDRIIEVLRKLLDMARQGQGDVLAEMPKRPGGDLPADVLQKLDEARKKLDEFLKQQKKVIEASENLAKRPVEDFTEEEQQKLKEMAATEDEWSKFMQELHTDLSKLPEQDFANPSLLSELVEIQTEIKMAEDALLKKTIDIAVPLEQLGYERAEEIKTNLEKWLPDTPDRERWSQEESLSDQDKEAPMAELPGELEDIVGELMEEEADLFDEMEDVSSSAADSLDIGAGWDTLDGPISNMSAKGVTGNRLPNTSEIGGRSGEGRSGKSSGEFVGDEAVGKGGRKTPSRLTPDPYVKGQIKDHSKDPTGGATGGGKESGQGGEGLEGPLPRPPGQRELQRLAGKQAALRNRAEDVDARFQVMNFHRTDLRRMIELMAQIELDLRSGRYQNALRQRRVLAEGLGNVKQYLEGEFEVRQDATSNLPAEIQKELLGSMLDPSPAGWEELNRQYFERLSTAGGDGSEPASGSAPAP